MPRSYFELRYHVFQLDYDVEKEMERLMTKDFFFVL